MIAATSLEAYQEVKKTLNERQTVVLNFIRQAGEVCNLDIAEGLGWPINCVTPRVLELRQKRLIYANSRRPSQSGRLANFWKINPQINHVRNIHLVKNPATVAATGGAVTQGDLF